MDTRAPSPHPALSAEGPLRLPRFVAHTAEELLALMRRLVAEQQRDGGDLEAFRTSFHAAMLDLNVVLDFGEALVREELDALGRFRALERRVTGRAFHPLLAGPVEDLLDTLRDLLHRLEVGLFHLPEFHHTFEEVAGRLESLLLWQSALDDSAAQAPTA